MITINLFILNLIYASMAVCLNYNCWPLTLVSILTLPFMFYYMVEDVWNEQWLDRHMNRYV